MFPLITIKIAKGQLNNIAGKMVIDPECCVTYCTWCGGGHVFYNLLIPLFLPLNCSCFRFPFQHGVHWQRSQLFQFPCSILQMFLCGLQKCLEDFLNIIWKRVPWLMLQCTCLIQFGHTLIFSICFIFVCGQSVTTFLQTNRINATVYL